MDDRNAVNDGEIFYWDEPEMIEITCLHGEIENLLLKYVLEKMCHDYDESPSLFLGKIPEIDKKELLNFLLFF